MLQVVCIMIWGLDSELEHEDLLYTDWAWAHNVAKLLFCSELVEELLFQQVIEESYFAWFKLVFAWSVRENTCTAIVDVFVEIDTFVLVNSLVVKFDTSFAIQRVFIHAWEVQNRLSFVNYLQCLALS